MIDVKNSLLGFERALYAAERSVSTVKKYLHDANSFLQYLNGRRLEKSETIAYKKYLSERYAPASVNSMLVALNCYLRFLGKTECCVRLPKIQKQIFCTESKELSCEEYRKLLRAARNTRLALVLRTICETGIRISELQYITAESVACGKAVVTCKNKTRVIFLPTALQKALKVYLRSTGIRFGEVFVTKNGKPLDRSNIWREMKALCAKAGIRHEKVFPHNLRHLFARTFYSIDHDIVRLADLLGHSSINTTRIYTAENGKEHLSRLEKTYHLLMEYI